MLIARLSIKGFYGVNIGFDLGPLTVITGPPPGSGKTMIIELLWRVFKGVRDRVNLDGFTRVGDARIDMTITLDEWVKRKLEEVGYPGDSVTISIGVDEGGYVQAIKIDNKEIIVTEYRNSLSRVKYPMDVDVADTSILLNPDGLTPKEQALQLVGSASEDFEATLSVIKILRDFIIGLGVYRIGLT
ncbi:ATP-binding protein [Vulcanisaeta souniana]|uniref:ATP-binding protein n=1 Tax=Vulcanisaeta souniana TaxID=164452 RepID=UPI001FB42CA3|nr:ATP-binding protein [Vulcanisaeta souniana]